MLIDHVAHEAEPHGVQSMQHRRGAVGVPPVARQRAEMGGFARHDAARGLAVACACVRHAPFVTGRRLPCHEEKSAFMPRAATRIVMKFGGTSMAGIERIRSVAARVKREAEAGHEVLVVVSAMAGETDRLIQLCNEAAALHDPKEYDVVVASGEQVTAGLLAMTLQNMGVKARSFMGWQLVRASGVHGNARVESVEGAQLDEALS